MACAVQYIFTRLTQLAVQRLCVFGMDAVEVTTVFLTRRDGRACDQRSTVAPVDLLNVRPQRSPIPSGSTLRRSSGASFKQGHSATFFCRLGPNSQRSRWTCPLALRIVADKGKLGLSRICGPVTVTAMSGFIGSAHQIADAMTHPGLASCELQAACRTAMPRAKAHRPSSRTSGCTF